MITYFNNVIMIEIFSFSLASDSGEESEVDESELNFLNVSH